MKKQIKVTVDEDLYNLLCKKSIKELGEINLSLFTKILYNKHVKKVENILLKSEIIKGGPVTYCPVCKRRKYTSQCKCHKIPVKINIIKKEN